MSLPPPTLFSIVIPARDEEGSVHITVQHVHDTLAARSIPHEIIVVNDGSKDGTWALLQELTKTIPSLRPVDNPGPHGIGRAIIYGLNHMQGDAVAIMMADESDSPNDLVRYWDLLCQGHECVFGSRFIKGGAVYDYPKVKMVLNRVANWFIKVIFHIDLNDTTNAFKAYRREVIDGCRPLIAPHFNLLVELPLKAIVRGYTWTTTPISWSNRKTGEAKLKIREMGSRYLFIILYVWLEKFFSRGDYRRQTEGRK
jgi:dolichol-phosphate mannosyltransferase